MSVADAIHDYHERSLPYLARLRLLSVGGTGPAPSPVVAAEVGRATGAVVAQAEAASRLALAASRSVTRETRPGLAQAARLARLTAAADDAIAAAREGNPATLRDRLRRFDALTVAIWAAEGPADQWAVPPARAGEGR